MRFKKPGLKDEPLWICFYMLPFVAVVGVDNSSMAFGLLVGLLAGLYAIGIFLVVRGRKKMIKWGALILSVALSLAADSIYTDLSAYYRNNRMEANYYSDGSVRNRVRLIDGKRHGPWLAWHQNGLLHERGYFLEDVAMGKWHYYDENGRKEQEGAYVDNLRTGRWKTWYPDGILRSNAYYKEDELFGRWIYFHENGVLAEFGDFVKGLETGRWISQDAQQNYVHVKYYQEGKVKDEREFVQ